MRTLFLTSFFILLTSAIFGQEVKKVKITDLEAYIKNSNRPQIVSFWATWCVPCIEEIPYFMDAVKKHSADSLELVLVNLDFASNYPRHIAQVIKSKHFVATFFWLNETNADYFCPKIDTRWDGAIPVSLFINNKTGYRHFFNRALTDRQVEPEVRSMLK